MTHPRLAARRNDTEPKCATCGWWRGATGATGATGVCDRSHIVTTDLTVCSGWRERADDPEILPPVEGKEW